MAKNYSNGNSEKEVHLLERRLIDLSRVAYRRDIITFTDFLNLNEQNILHTLPKDSLYTGYILFGGYASAERQMAAFIPEALSLRYGKKNLLPEELGYPFQAVEICPRNIRFAEDLTHRDFLGEVLNLGIEAGPVIFCWKNIGRIFLHRQKLQSWSAGNCRMCGIHR